MFGSQASSSSYIRCLFLLLLRLDGRGRLQQRHHRWRREEEPLCTKSKMRMSPLMRRLLRLTAFLSVMMLVAIDGRTTGVDDADDAKSPSGKLNRLHEEPLKKRCRTVTHGMSVRIF